MKPFHRIPRGSIFQTGETVKEHSTFCKLTATVAVPIENGQTVPTTQYIPLLNQRCRVLGHVND